MAFVTDSNRPQPLRQPPPTAYLTASEAASEVPSLRMHPCPAPPVAPWFCCPPSHVHRCLWSQGASFFVWEAIHLAHPHGLSFLEGQQPPKVSHYHPLVCLPPRRWDRCLGPEVWLVHGASGAQRMGGGWTGPLVHTHAQTHTQTQAQPLAGPCPPPPPCPPSLLSYQGSIATGHTYGGAKGARKFFFHSPCPRCIPPRPGGGAPQRYTCTRTEETAHP